MSVKIAVAGLGYVGLSNAILLAQHNRVTAVDVDAARVGLINQRRSPIQDPDCADWLARGTLDLTATTDPAAYAGANFVVIATPTKLRPRDQPL